MEEINLKELMKFIISKIKIVILFVIASIGIGAIYINYVITPMYHSSTTLILVSNDTTQNSALMQSEVTLNKNLVTTYSEIVKSRSVLSQVIDELDLDLTIKELSDSTTVSSVENTEIIKIQVSNKDNKEAKRIATATANIFMKEVQKIYNLTNVSVVDKAYLEKSPYNISPIKQLLIFTVGGFCLSILVIFLIFYFDTTIKSSTDIEEKLGLPVIGNVTLVNNNKKGK